MIENAARNIYKARILLVEDEHFMRSLLVQALNSVGFSEIREAENGHNALQSLEMRGADIVVTDIEMKPVNGFDLVRAIRSGEAHVPRETPVVFLSGLSDVSTLSSASQLDVQGFLVKPVNANRLREKLTEALHKKITLHPPMHYQPMRLGHASNDAAARDSAAENRTTPAPRPPKPQAATQDPSHPTDDNGNIETSLLMLEAGMTLCHDVRARGALLLKDGTELLPQHIAVLQDLRAVLDTQRFMVKLPEQSP